MMMMHITGSIQFLLKFFPSLKERENKMQQEKDASYKNLALKFIDNEKQKFREDEGKEIFNLKQYDLGNQSSPRFQTLVHRCSMDLEEKNIAIMPDFVKSKFIDKISAELTELDQKEYNSKSFHNPYFSPKDNKIPKGHPINIYSGTSNGFIAYDDLPDGSTLKKIFFSSMFVKFLSACVGEHNLCQFADPLTCMTVNVMKKNQKLGWHFDTPKYSITLLIAKADVGGAFQFSPNIRDVESGVENYSNVATVLKGSSQTVETVSVSPGSLQIFKGRNALHQVKEVKQGTRKMAIFSFDPEPGKFFHPKKSLDLFGRTGFEKLSV